MRSRGGSVAETLFREHPGDDYDAPCYGLDKDKDPFRSVPHAWRSVMKKPEKISPFDSWKCPCGQTTMTPFLDHCFHCGAPFPHEPQKAHLKVCDCSTRKEEFRIEVCDTCRGIRSIKVT